jgi:hypothetical protein
MTGDALTMVGTDADIRCEWYPAVGTWRLRAQQGTTRCVRPELTKRMPNTDSLLHCWGEQGDALLTVLE